MILWGCDAGGNIFLVPFWAPDRRAITLAAVGFEVGVGGLGKEQEPLVSKGVCCWGYYWSRLPLEKK